MGRLRLYATILLLISAGSLTGFLLWKEEFRYSLPTPVPEAYNPLPVGECIEFPAQIFSNSNNQPVFLHFFNPECPCSRFNLNHFHEIHKKYRDQAHFQVVIPANASFKRARELLDASIPIIVDREDKWTQATGVFATPQAVVLEPDGRLFYRGNYNKARFCTIPGSNFAEISLGMLLQAHPAPKWGLLATTTYGCEFDNPRGDELVNFFKKITNSNLSMK